MVLWLRESGGRLHDMEPQLRDQPRTTTERVFSRKGSTALPAAQVETHYAYG